MLNPSIDVVWKPIPNSSQSLALDTRCHHTLYHGARGPGKTDTQLMRFRSFVGQGYGSFWRGVIFDREYKNLDDLVAKSKRWFYKFDDGARFLESKSDYKWIWPTGEELLFRAVKKPDDYWNYHGQEFPFIGWNELCKYPTSDLYDRLMSCNRSSYTPEKDGFIGGIVPHGETLPVGPKGETPDNIPLEVFSTTNSYGPGRIWVKRRFIDPAPHGGIVRTTSEVFNPRTQREEPVTKTQVAIFGSYKENIYLDPGYIADLMSISDENMRNSWLDGSWDISAGGAMGDLWQTKTHVLPRFAVPSNWPVDRCLDWGSSHPFSVGWFAEANGEEVKLPDGTSFCPPPGTIIQIAEWYGAKEFGTNKGLKLSATSVAEGIRERELWLTGREGSQRWCADPWPGPADNQIRNVISSETDTIEQLMRKRGVTWSESDKSPGSRVVGLELVRNRLEASTKREGPGIYFMANCRASVALLPVLPRDEVKIDDVDTDAEDHAYDMVRYRVLKGNRRIAKKVNVSHAR